LYREDNRFLALFWDGGVRWLDSQMEADSLRALLTIAGGELVDDSVFKSNKP
jgi:hypothetical protein